MDIEKLNRLKETLHGYVTKGAQLSPNATTIALALLGIYISYMLISGVFFCPLGHIPGPFLTRFGEGYWQYTLMAGSSGKDLAALHNKYGKSSLGYSSDNM
jgi:hypothetical protein